MSGLMTSLYLCNVERQEGYAETSLPYIIEASAKQKKEHSSKNKTRVNNKTNKKHFKEKRNFYSEALSLLDKTLPNLQNSTHEQNPHYYTK